MADTERMPNEVFVSRGKKDSVAAMAIFEVVPNPNHKTNSGTSATLGTTCEATTNGFPMASSGRTRPIT